MINNEEDRAATSSKLDCLEKYAQSNRMHFSIGK